MSMKADEAQLWLSYAKSDLDAAYVLLEKGDFFPRQICFMSQQAGEKALKAILVYLEINFPKTLDLDRIRELIPEGWAVKEKFPNLLKKTEIMIFGKNFFALRISRSDGKKCRMHCGMRK